MRVALYLRRSTYEELQPYSLEAQEELLRSYAATHEHKGVRVFADNASGRTTAKRTAFQELIALVKRGAPFEGILVRDVSRWGRFENVDESAFYEFIGLSRGVQVVYVDESFGADASPYATMMKSI